MPALILRPATLADVPAIVALLADDELSRARETTQTPLDPAYIEAFARLEADDNHVLIVADLAGEAVGTMQLSFLPGLARRGAWRGQIEAVRIRADHRGCGLGRQMLDWALSQCRARNCRVVQLTTDKSRLDAHRFYERLGFVASHIGYKIDLETIGDGTLPKC